MDTADILFPQKIGRLSYRVPAALAHILTPGMLVRTELRKSIKVGLVLGPARNVPRSAKLKDLDSLMHPEPVLNPAMMELLPWMSRYYHTREGLVLKAIFPRELFEPVSERAKKSAASQVSEPPAAWGNMTDTAHYDEHAAAVTQQVEAASYGALLRHAPSTVDEQEFLLHAIENLSNVILIVPEQASLAALAERLRERFGDRLAHYHSGMSHGARTTALEGVINGTRDIVLGNLSAVFAPLPRVSLIAVLQEHSTHYRAESMPRFQARDMAVKRASLEGCTVLLSSICPSCESMFNARTGKYTFLDASTRARRPRVKVMDMRRAEGPLAEGTAREIRRHVAEGKRTMVYLNRFGYASLRCGECAYVPQCPRCSVPLVLHKSNLTMRCSLCNHTQSPPSTCPTCGGTGLTPSSSGLERIGEALAELNPVEVTGKTSASVLSVLNEDDQPLTVGTKALLGRDTLSHRYALAVVASADAYLFRPDFRATERAFQELIYAADRLHPDDGQLIIQTFNPDAAVVVALRTWRLGSFYDQEIQARRETGYPPFGRLAMLTLKSASAALPDVQLPRGCEVLGPVAQQTQRGTTVGSVMVKAPSTQTLTEAVRLLTEALTAVRKEEPLSIEVI